MSLMLQKINDDINPLAGSRHHLAGSIDAAVLQQRATTAKGRKISRKC